jgi:4-diphosphocytidyl-2-C-methyl-D-erythritol kinase
VIRTAAPAKVNLFLEVLGKRADGYHELDTVFLELDLCDRLSVSDDVREGEIVVSVTGDPTVPSGPENLAFKAAEKLRARIDRPALAARIEIEKRVPAGGGLGGGSSDAAAAIRALDELHGLGLPRATLEEVAAAVGSDSAFFIVGGLQRGRGRGERLVPLPDLERPLHLVLLLPGIACPTRDVYGALAPFLRDGCPRTPEWIIEALRDGDPEMVARELWNRLEGPCFELFPEVAQAKRELEAQGLLGCLLAGSGSTVFGVARDREEALRVAGALAAGGRRAIAVRGGARGLA